MDRRSLSLTHLVREPAVPSPGAPPMLILLHGFGSNEQDLIELASYLDPRLLTVSARAPLVLQPGAYAWYHVNFTPDGPAYDPEEAEQGLEAAIRFIQEAPAAYGADSARVYLMGFSQGAIMSLAATLRHPERVAGAVIMSGRMLPETGTPYAGTDALRNTPIIVTHGVMDGILPIACGREIRDALARLPVQLEYHEYPMAHSVSEESLTDIAGWLAARLDDA